MNNSVFTPLIFLMLLLTNVNRLHAQGTSQEFYQLKVYTIGNEAQENSVDEFLKNALIPTARQHNLGPIGVFKIIPDKFKKADKIYVLIPFPDLAAFVAWEKLLETDVAFKKKGQSFLDAPYNKPPFERVSSILMKAFAEMPQMKPATIEGERKNRVYELRSYESPTEAKYWNKVNMFNEGGEVTLFDSLGFHAVFYAEVLSGDRMPNLMYMTTFKDRQTRDALWEDFSASKKWKELTAEEKYKNNVNKADIHLLYPTDYSDY